MVCCFHVRACEMELEYMCLEGDCKGDIMIFTYDGVFNLYSCVFLDVTVCLSPYDMPLCNLLCIGDCSFDYFRI